MTKMICAVVTTATAFICAWIASKSSWDEKVRKIDEVKAQKRADQRSKEAMLQLAMIAANLKLTVGVAMVLKHGHANGEVEEGLAAVEAANSDYTKFLEDLALEHIKK